MGSLENLAVFRLQKNAGNAHQRMKILWVGTRFLHPIQSGEQVRIFETLRQLHKNNEVYFVAFNDPGHPEGLAKSGEYCSFAHPVDGPPAVSAPIHLAGRMINGLLSPIPQAALRWRSQEMRDTVASLVFRHKFDAKVCNSIYPSVNIHDLSEWTLFQHCVESVALERCADTESAAVRRAYPKLQSRKLLDWEREVCRQVARVVAVSDSDIRTLKERFGAAHVSLAPTGVNLSYFERPATGTPRQYDLLFTGCMDWLPNIDAVHWFLDEVLPLIRREMPLCRLAIAGRNPPESIVLESRDPLITVAGAVADIRPFLWESAVSIVPLRIAGGIRLGIFEAMAAQTAVVSTSAGAEGLPVQHGNAIRIANSAEQFASACLTLMQDAAARSAVTAAGLELVRSGFSWEQVTRQFEQQLVAEPLPASQTA